MSPIPLIPRELVQQVKWFAITESAGEYCSGIITDCSSLEEYAPGKKAVSSALEASFLGGERIQEGVGC